MPTKNHSSKRQVKLFVRFIDHVMANSSQRDDQHRSNENDQGLGIDEVGKEDSSKEYLNEMITEEIRVPVIGRNDDKHVDMAEDGENGGSDIATNEVFENFDHNEPNIVHSEKDNLDKQTINVEGNDKYSRNSVNLESEEELGVKSNDKVQKLVSYAKMVEKDEIPKDLNYIPTIITEFSIEVVVFDEMLVKKGLSALASSFGRPILMDTMTATMRHTGNENFNYARVLTEMDAEKEFKNEIETQYKDNKNRVKGVKKFRPNNVSNQGQQKEWKNAPGFKKQEYRRKKFDNTGNMEVNKERLKLSNATEKRRPLKEKEMEELRKAWSKDMIRYFKEKWEEDRRKEMQEYSDDVGVEDVIEHSTCIAKVMKKNVMSGSESRKLWKSLELDRRFANERPLTNELEELKKEKEGLESKLTGFESAAKDLDTLLQSQRSDKNKEGLGYSDVSPFLLKPSPSIESNSSDLQNNNSTVSEHEESSESIMSKPMIKFVKAADCSEVKTNKAEAARKSSVKYAEMYRNTFKSPKVRGNQRNWNNLVNQRLGISAVRRVNTAAHRPNVNSARPKTTQDLVIILIQRVKRLERELKARNLPTKIHKVDGQKEVEVQKSKKVVDYTLQVKIKLLINKLEDSKAEHQV
nr:zinc knuckle CX2CX4HX4C [Tanacetum cinerariifolium]